jgi:hypothetical protein
MGVVVDKSRRHGEAAGIDSFRRAVFYLADFDDSAVFDGDIGDVRRQAGTVDNAPTADNQIISHGKPPIETDEFYVNSLNQTHDTTTTARLSNRRSRLTPRSVSGNMHYMNAQMAVADLLLSWRRWRDKQCRHHG